MRTTVPLMLVLVLACAPKPGGGAADSTRAAPGAAVPDSARSDTVAAAEAGVPLEGTAWRLVELGGKPVTALADSSWRPGLTLLVDGHKVQGSAGCNRMTGNYQVSGASLRFGPLVTTRMACAALKAERAYLDALGATTRYEIVGTSLTLYGANGPVARLEAPAPA
jgi:heat shock protein HslJ